MTDDVARQVPLPDTIDVIRRTLLAPLPANTRIRRDEFGVEIKQPRHLEAKANRSDSR